VKRTNLLQKIYIAYKYMMSLSDKKWQTLYIWKLVLKYSTDSKFESKISTKLTLLWFQKELVDMYVKITQNNIKGQLKKDIHLQVLTTQITKLLH